MIRYALEDIDGNQFDLSDSGDLTDYVGRNSLTMTETRTLRELNTVEKSYLPGQVQVSTPRIRSKTVSFEMKLFNPDSDNFRALVNNVLYWLNKTVYIVDIDADLRLKVSWSDHKQKYKSGSLFQGSEDAIQFEVLEPYWEDATATTDTDSGTAFSFSVGNIGYLNTTADFTLTASTACNKFSIINDTTGLGIVVTDLAFGVGSLTEYTILNSQGLVYLSETGLVNPLLRNTRVKAGTGFFDMPRGTNTVNIAAASSLSVTVSHRNRYFI